MRPAIVVLPMPVGQTRATTVPGAISRSMVSRIQSPRSYLKLTSWNAIAPFASIFETLADPERWHQTEQIIQAALQVCAERGMEKARMEDIGNAADLSKATLYLYFKTKDALIGAIMRRMVGYMLRDLRTPPEGEGTVGEQLRAFGAELVAEIQKMRPLLPLLYEFYAMGLRRQAAREALGEFVTEYIATLAPLIGQGVASGELRQVDAEKTAISLGAMLEGTLLMWAFAPELVDIESQITYGVELFLSSMR